MPTGWGGSGKIAALRGSCDPEAWGWPWEHNPPSLAGIDMDDEVGARNLYASLMNDQGPIVRAHCSLPHFIIPSSLENTQPIPLVTLNSPTPEQAFLAKNHNKNARCVDRDPRGILRIHKCVSAGLVGPLDSSSFPLPTVERKLAEMNGSGTCAALGASASESAQARRCRLSSGVRRAMVRRLGSRQRQCRGHRMEVDQPDG